MLEAGVLLDMEGWPILWHTPEGRTVGSLPDSPDLWETIWELRLDVMGFAHSHPGAGIPAPSWTDITTFAAVESALGRRISWWITSATHVIEVRYEGPEKHDYKSSVVGDCWWVHELRERSNQ